MNKFTVTQELYERAIKDLCIYCKRYDYTHIYGIPRGGTQIAVSMVNNDRSLTIIDDPECHKVYIGKILIVDDLFDSGRTAMKYIKKGFRVAAAFSKKIDVHPDVFYTKKIPDNLWAVFPWEAENDEEELVTRMLELIGEDPTREGLVETPKRVLKAWKHWFQGYNQNPADIMKTFEDDTSDEIVLLKDIEFYSTCEHHLAPFLGKAHIAYIPDGKILGASKLARLLDIYARRLQIQERIAQQVVNAIEEYLKPKGAACYIEAKHLCISSRGVEKQNSVFVTSALTGCFKDNPAARAEFFSMIK